MLAATSRSSTARSALVADSRLLASSTSPDRQSRSDPQDLVADIRLQAVERQDHPALPGQNGAQPVIVGERGRHELVVAVEQVGDRALRDHHPALAQGAVDLGHAVVLAVAQGADQGDDVEAELVLRQDDGPLGLRPVGHAASGLQPGFSQRRICRRRRTKPSSVATVRRLS